MKTNCSIYACRIASAKVTTSWTMITLSYSPPQNREAFHSVPHGHNMSCPERNAPTDRWKIQWTWLSPSQCCRNSGKKLGHVYPSLSRIRKQHRTSCTDIHKSAYHAPSVFVFSIIWIGGTVRRCCSVHQWHWISFPCIRFYDFFSAKGMPQTIRDGNDMNSTSYLFIHILLNTLHCKIRRISK